MYYQQTRPEMLAFLPNEFKTSLEVGCGEAVFSSTLDSGTERWGVEPNQKAAELARGKGYTVLSGLFEECVDQLPDNYFDLVICNDVIEHMVNHDEFFASIKSKLAPGAVIIGSIPNIRYYKNIRQLLIEKEWRYQDAGILDRTHLRFFTEKSLLRTFSEHNYRVEKFEGINKVRGFKFFVLILQVLSLGSWSDVQYTQFGFRISIQP